MIVRMKKVTLLCMESDREATLASLQDLGVLHLAHVKTVQPADVKEDRASLDRTRSAWIALKSAAEEAEPETCPIPTAEPHSMPEVVEAIHRALARKRELQDRLDTLARERAAVEPYKDLDPDLARRLGEKGLRVSLYFIPGKTRPACPTGALMVPIREDSSGAYFAVVSQDEVSIEAQPRPMPARRLAAIDAERDDLVRDAKDVQKRLGSLSRHAAELQETLKLLGDRLQMAEARAGMGQAPSLCYLKGFCPVDQVESVRAEARQRGWGLMIEDPAAGDAVPTLIRSSRWVRPIDSLFKMIRILPGYHEADISPFFLVFLSIFFAMIVGDAAYGALYLIAIRLARRRFKKRPPEPFQLLTLFSLCTMAWGVLTGVYFGVKPAWAPRVTWLTDVSNIMSLCMLIGCIHLTIAHGWALLRMINSLRCLAHLGWIMIVWTIFFIGQTLFMNVPLPGWTLAMGGVGLLFLVLFMTPVSKLKAEWINHAMLPLSLFSTFGDVLSYLRLFALGTAGVEVGNAFNTMAVGFGFKSILSVIAMVLLLGAAHGLNMILCLGSVLIHGIRLNTLEFSMHLGMEWSGAAYVPFARSSQESGVDATNRPHRSSDLLSAEVGSPLA